MNVIGSVSTGVVIAGHESCDSDEFLFTLDFFDMRFGSDDDEMNDTPTSQCDFMTDLAVYRLWCEVISV